MRINKSFIALTSSDASVSWSNITGTPTTLSGYGITDGVPTSRTLTINGTTYDLSANRTWTISSDNIYTANGTLTANRTMTMGGYSLTFTGSATSPVINSTGRILLGGASDNVSYLLSVNGSALITNVFSTLMNCTSVTAQNGQFTSLVRLSETAGPTTPASGFGFMYAKTDKKVYWKNSDGTEYDLTANSGTPAGSNTQVQFNNSGAFGADSNFVWDNSNKRLGIGTASPTTTLDVTGAAKFSSSVTVNSNLIISNTAIEQNDSNGLTLNSSNASGSIKFRVAGAERMILNSSGNFGLGVTPSAWGASQKAIQIGSTFTSALYHFSGGADNYTVLANNSFYDGANDKYISTGLAASYFMNNGTHVWRNAASGTAGANFTYINAMTLTANGRLLLGTTTEGSELLQVNGTSRFTGNITIDDTGTAVLSAQGNVSTNFFINSRSTLTFQTGGPYGASTTRLTIGSTGAATFSSTLGINGVSDNVKSGTYTPTLTNVANISTNEAFVCNYTRIDTIVTVFGSLNITPTSGSTTTTIGVSLPIASNFGNFYDAWGVFNTTDGTKSGGMDADTTNDRMNMTFTSVGTGTKSYYFSFSYRII